MTLICFASPKGGVGKTTLAANVANELARAGLRVIALDLDPQNALRLHFGVPLGDTVGFTHLLTQQPDWRHYLRSTPVGVSLLPYGSSAMRDAIALSVAIEQTPALIQRPVDDILSSPDTCLVVDTPPGPSSLLAALLPRTDLLLSVLLVDAMSISLIPAVEQGRSYGAGAAEGSGPAMGFILNQFNPRTRLGGVIADAATQHLGERLLGMVYRDEYVTEAAAAQKVLANYAPASKANHDIVAISRAILTRLRLPLPAADGQRSKILA
jgi:cellulose synthase operon protein YhjQ